MDHLVDDKKHQNDLENVAFENDVELEESQEYLEHLKGNQFTEETSLSYLPVSITSLPVNWNQKPPSSGSPTAHVGPIPIESSGTSIKMQLQGIATITGSFLIHLTLGNFFTLGNMTPYVMSYLKNRGGYDVSYSLAIWINSLQYLGQGSLMVVGGILEKKIGGRFTCIIGGLVFCGAITASGYFIKFGFIAFAFVYGIVACWGLGIAYIAPLAVGMRWYPQNKGLVNGVILSGYGLGALVFNQVQSAFLNPRNIQPGDDGFFNDADVLDRVPNVFYVMGAIYGSLQIIGIILLFKPASDLEEANAKLDLLKNGKGTQGKLYTVEPKSLPQSNKSVYSLVPKEMGPREMFKRKEFFAIWLTFALISQCVQFINTYYKTYGQIFIHDDRFLSIVGSLASICNCLGRIAFGRIQDKTNYKLAAIVITLSLTALMLSFVVVPSGGKVTFVIWVLLTFFVFSGVFPIMPTATDLSFGSKYAGTNFGLIFTAPAISSVLGAFVIQMVLNKVGWAGTFFTVAGFTFIGFIINVFMPDQLELIR